MKRIVFGSMLSLLFIALTSLVPAEKIKYTSDEGKLSVVFPSQFATSVQKEDLYKTVKAQAVYNNVVFFVAYSIHEQKLDKGQNMSKVSLDSFTEALQATNIVESPWKVRKNEGLKATFEATEATEGSVVGEYRVVIIGQTQYQITVVGPTENWDEKAVKKFMSHLK